MNSDVFDCLLHEIHRERLTRQLLLHVFGEPLLHPSFKEYVKKAKDLGFRLVLSTNGYLLDEEMAHFLTDMLRGDDLISVSFKSFVERAYVDHGLASHHLYKKRVMDLIATKVRKGSPVRIALSLMKNTIYSRKLLRLQPDCERYVVRTNEFEELKEEICRIVSRNPQDLVTTSSLDYLRRVTELRFSPDIILLLSTMEELCSDNEACKRHETPYGYCRGLLDHFTISSAGDVGPCCYQDVNYEITFGNTAENSLNEILRKEKVRRFREKIDRFVLPHPFCRLCRGANSLPRLWLRLAVMYSKLRRDRLLFKEPKEWV